MHATDTRPEMREAATQRGLGNDDPRCSGVNDSESHSRDAQTASTCPLRSSRYS